MLYNEQVITIMTEMIHARGYSIKPYQEGVFIANKDDCPNIHIYLLNMPLNKSLIVHYISVFMVNNITHAIIIYNDSITSSVKKTLKNVINCRIELFNSKELKFNITKHVLVPKHEKVSTDGHSEIQRYPTILKSDPIVRFYGFKVGDLIKITRPTGLYYRVVRSDKKIL